MNVSENNLEIKTSQNCNTNVLFRYTTFFQNIALILIVPLTFLCWFIFHIKKIFQKIIRTIKIENHVMSVSSFSFLSSETLFSEYFITNVPKTVKSLKKSKYDFENELEI